MQFLICGTKKINKFRLSFCEKDGVTNGKSKRHRVSDDSKEHVTEVIKNYQKTNNVEFESPVDLMDAICDEYGWQWEDFYYDIEIVSD